MALDLRTDSLTPHSRRFAAVLFHAHPAFLEHARLEAGDDQEHHTFLVEVPPPAANRPALFIDTYDDEVTVRFESWHEHFPLFPDDSEPEAFQEALQCIAGILSEDIAIAVSMKDNKCIGAHKLAPDESLPALPDGGWLYVRSWRGTRDSG